MAEDSYENRDRDRLGFDLWFACGQNSGSLEEKKKGKFAARVHFSLLVQGVWSAMLGFEAAVKVHFFDQIIVNARVDVVQGGSIESTSLYRSLKLNCQLAQIP